MGVRLLTGLIAATQPVIVNQYSVNQQMDYQYPYIQQPVNQITIYQQPSYSENTNKKPVEYVQTEYGLVPLEVYNRYMKGK